MISIWCKRLLRAGVGLLLLMPMVGLWVTTTEPGLRFVIKQASSVISADTVSGSLRDMRLEGVQITLQESTTKASVLKLSWNPIALLSGSLRVQYASLSEGQVRLLSTSKKESISPWEGVKLPFDIVVDELRANELEIVYAEQGQFQFEEISGGLSVVNNVLVVDSLSVKSILTQLTVDANIGIGAEAGDKITIVVDGQGLYQPREMKVESSLEFIGTWQQLELRGQLVAKQANSSRKEKIESAISGRLLDLLTPSPRFELDGAWSVPFSMFQMGVEAKVVDGFARRSKGSFRVAGDVNAFRYELSGDTYDNEQRLLNIVANGQGDLDRLTLSELSVKSISSNQEPISNFSASGSIDWKHNVSWDMSGSMFQLDPSLFLPTGLRGLSKISGQLLSQGRLLDDAQNPLGIVGSIAASKISASWHGEPVTAEFKLDATRTEVALQKFSIQGESFVVGVQGVLSDDSQLEWNIDASELRRVWPMLEGELQAQAKMTGSLSSPNIEFDLSGKELGLRSEDDSDPLRVGLLVANGELAGLNDNSPMQLSLNVDNFTRSGEIVAQSINATLDGSKGKHTLKLLAQLTDKASVTSSLTGELVFDNQRGEYDSLSWVGQVSDLTLDSPWGKAWELNAPVNLDLSRDVLKLEPLCLTGGLESLCLRVESNLSLSKHNVMLSLEHVELAILDSYLSLQGLKFKGSVSGKFIYELNGAESTPIVTGSIDGNAIQISLPQESIEAHLEIDQIDGQTNQRKWLSLEAASLRLSQAGAAQASLDIWVNDDHYLIAKLTSEQAISLTNFRDLPIRGAVDLEWADLSSFPIALADGMQINGHLAARLDISGSVSSPQISMRSELSESTLYLPTTGVTYTNISAQATSISKSQIQFNGKLQAGEGEMTYGGLLNFTSLDSPAASFELAGEQLRLLQTSEIDAAGSIDLKLTFENQVSSLSGFVTVDRADLQLGAQETVVDVSEDVVLAGEDNDAPLARQKLRLTIDLGNETTLSTAGLKAKLKGKFNISQDPGQLMIGQGQIDVLNGLYQAYGEELTISKGQLIFNGSSVDNPNIDLEATRKVDSVTVGVRVQGTVQAPYLRLFANPAMSDQDVLSMLIFGKSISSLGGEDSLTLLRIVASLRGNRLDSLTRMTSQLQNALGLNELELRLAEDSPELVAGKQLTSQFYIGYGYGLLDAAQSLVLRFKINEAWSIQGDLGANNGVDIRYQIER